jgi:hypothetical protein
MKVTPDKLAPIIPNATTYQGDCLLPRKKASLLSLFPVKNEIEISIKKYAIIITIINAEDIIY